MYLYSELRTYYSTEVNETIDTKHFKWHGDITVDVRDIQNAVTIEVTLLENLDEDDGTVSALHVATRLDQGLCQALSHENRNCALKLESELWDRSAGTQLDLQISRPHTLKEGQVKFIQYLVREEEIKRCSIGSVDLILKARFYTYPDGQRTAH